MNTSVDAREQKGKDAVKTANAGQSPSGELEPCSGPQAAEAARLEAEDEACDDGRK